MDLRPKGRSVTPTPFVMSSLVAFASLLTLYAGLSFGLLAGTAELARQSNYQACQRSAIARGVSADGCSVFLEVR